MRILHLTASPFFGGPERQMLGLAEHLPNSVETDFVSFAEGGRCRPFLAEARRRGHPTTELTADTPKLWAARNELTALFQRRRPDIVITHGYKANLIGRLAARRAGVRVMGVARGWTGESRKVGYYEWLDKRMLGRLDHVVTVSDGLARRVLATGLAPDRLSVIRNSLDPSRFGEGGPIARQKLAALIPSYTPSDVLVVAAGRLTPDKGFHVLIAAMQRVVRHSPGVKLIIFGEGSHRGEWQAILDRDGLAPHVVFGGFRHDLDELIPAADLFVLPSFREGLPNVILEAQAAGVPCVATAVDGTPEAMIHGETGFLVPPNDEATLANRVVELARDGVLRRTMGDAGRDHVTGEFTFERQAGEYLALWQRLYGLAPAASRVAHATVAA